MPLLSDRIPPQRNETLVQLGAWDQASMRAYMRVALCFRFDNESLASAVAHIKASLVRLGQQRPDFAGTLEVHSDGLVFLRTNQDANTTIPFSVVDLSSQFPNTSYTDLKTAGFPPSFFVSSHFSSPCSLGEGMPGAPVAVVKAFVVPGGLLLGIFFCHAFADGDCLRIFLETFAGQTCSNPVDGPSTKHLSIPGVCVAKKGGMDKAYLDSLLDRVPEYVLLDKPIGPILPKLRIGGIPMDDIVKIGKVFVFNNDRLLELRRSIAAAAGAANSNKNAAAALPSNYICLAALTWTHLVRARMADPVKYVAEDPSADTTALLQTMVNWKGRAFAEANVDYFGNATAVAVTQLPTNGATLTQACSDRVRLAELVQAIEKTVVGVDEAYVRDRTALFAGVADPRLVGLRFDPRTPQDLGFNTWRYFGADTQWTIPGVSAAPQAPDTIRRLQDVWNMSGALILPAKALSTEHELLVTLPKTSMDLLCQDREWISLVDRVVE